MDKVDAITITGEVTQLVDINPDEFAVAKVNGSYVIAIKDKKLNRRLFTREKQLHFINQGHKVKWVKLKGLPQ